MIDLRLGDCLTKLKEILSESIDCCITSPPYWGLRDYGVECQLGLEKTPEEYVDRMVEVFREVKRVLKKEGTLWLNLGDTYNANYRWGGLDTCGKIQLGNKGSHNFMNINRKKDRTTKRWGGGQNHVEGLLPKNLVGIPWRVAFALQKDGWYLRQDIIWHKPNPMPESVTDRCTKAHEYIFLLAKNQKYYFDNKAISEPYIEPMNRWGGQKLKAKGESTWDKGTGQQTYRDRDMRPNNGRNKRSVWTVTTKPFKGAHFATFPENLILPCVLAGCPKGGLILDPFAGAGTTGVVAKKNNRNFIGIELNPKYIELAQRRINNTEENLL